MASLQFSNTLLQYGHRSKKYESRGERENSQLVKVIK